MMMMMLMSVFFLLFVRAKELNEILATCDEELGEQGALMYNDLDQVLNKIYSEVNA